jgi:hypothetical protein
MATPDKTTGGVFVSIRNILSEILNAIKSLSISPESEANANNWDVRVTKVDETGTAKRLEPMEVHGGMKLAIRARPTNTDYVYIARSAENTDDDNKRLMLSAGSSTSLQITNANLIWVNGAAPNGVDAWCELK